VIVSPSAYTHASSHCLLQSLPGPVSVEGIELPHFPIHVVGKGSTRAIQSRQLQCELITPSPLSAVNVCAHHGRVTLVGSQKHTRFQQFVVTCCYVGTPHRAPAYCLLCSSVGCFGFLLPFIRVVATFIIQPKTLKGRASLRV
jgi:hypothetical protein